MELTEEVKALLLNDSQRTQGQRTPDVHGTDSSSVGPGWSAAGRT